jgi:DNA-binding response OmpR family regulator
VRTQYSRQLRDLRHKFSGRYERRARIAREIILQCDVQFRLLLCLAKRAGEIVSLDELLNQVWTGVIVTPDSVYQAIATLRRHLADVAADAANGIRNAMDASSDEIE